MRKHISSLLHGLSPLAYDHYKKWIICKDVTAYICYKLRTAWKMLHKYRIAMVRSEREQLSGTVEIDETLIGGIEHSGERGRGADKAVVVIAIETEEPKGFGRVRMRHIPDASGDALITFICDLVKLGSDVQTDEWSGYNPLQPQAYLHQQVILSAQSNPAHVSMPGVHRVSLTATQGVLFVRSTIF